MDIREKFETLGVDHAPGQEKIVEMPERGMAFFDMPVDFSHGDVNAHTPIPGSAHIFQCGVEEGAVQAYTPYKGRKQILYHVAGKLSDFTNSNIDPETQLILTNGTQGALFLAMGANIMPGDKVAIISPDYFANRKMVSFFNGEAIPVHLHWQETKEGSGIDLKELETAFQNGAKLFLFSNPNNPTGTIYSKEEISKIGILAKRYEVTVIVDELYSRQIYDGKEFFHLCASKSKPDSMITIMGPSKTESMSGYRLGTAFGSADIISRMEKLQAIMSLRCAGYNQAVFNCWFNEPEGWLSDRVCAHQAIRDDLMAVINEIDGVTARASEGGSYLFVTIPELTVDLHDFVCIAREATGVTVTPGTEFGAEYTNHFRINFSQDYKAAVAALQRLLQFMKLYLPEEG